MLLRPVNLLILDEPTNHLDIYSKDIFLDTLKKFSGTVIFVSHDRAFMESLSTKTLELRATPSGSSETPRDTGKHRLFYGNYAYYLERLEREAANGNAAGTIDNRGGVCPYAAGSVPTRRGLSLHGGVCPYAAGSVPSRRGLSLHDGVCPCAEGSVPSRRGLSLAAGTTDNAAAKNDASPAAPLPRTILVKAGSAPVLSAAEQREVLKQKQTLIRRLERQEEEILAELESLEMEKSALEVELGKPEVYSNGEKARAVKARLDAAAAAAEGKSREWEAKAEELKRAKE
jgi:ATP-binding cassette subfamily F protein 3